MYRTRTKPQHTPSTARGVVVLLSLLWVGLAACPPPCPQTARPRCAACPGAAQRPPTKAPDCAGLCTYFTYCRSRRWMPPKHMATQILGCTTQCGRAKPGTDAQKIFNGIRGCSINRSCVAMMSCLEAVEAKIRAAKPKVDPNVIYKVAVSGSPTRGPADALVTLVMFSDHECGFCRRAYTVIKAALKKYPRVLRLVYKNFPLPNHIQGMVSARAAACVLKQKGAVASFTFHDKAMVATDLSEKALLTLAKASGADPKGVAKCMAAKQGLPIVKADLVVGEGLGIDGTPTFYINGKRYPGLLNVAELDQAIAEARARAEAAVKTGIKPAGVYAYLIAKGATKLQYLPPKRPTPRPRPRPRPRK